MRSEDKGGRTFRGEGNDSPLNDLLIAKIAFHNKIN